MNYDAFLKSKIITAPESGFDLPAAEVSKALKPHQRDAVIWACKGGRRALFESFGLGKTVQELEWMRQVLRHCGGMGLIVLPLGVRQEFMRDAVQLLHMDAPQYITHQEQAVKDGTVYLTNYERVRDGDIDPTAFTACALDEASVLRSFGSKTYQTFLDKLRGVKYKLVATATPSPNKYKELIHYAGFLEVMDTGQALTRFFKRDSTKANNLTLYPHKEEEFWLWVSSWALMIVDPSDLGYDAAGYILPEMEIRTHVLRNCYNSAEDRDGQIKMANDVAMSLQEASREKRDSIAARVAMAKEIVDSDPDAHFILWHDLEAERHEIMRQVPGTVDIYGSMDYDERERRVIDFDVSKLQAVYRKFSRDTVYSYEDHVALAKQLDEDGRLPATFMVVAPGSWTDQVWDDINRMRTLNTNQTQAKRVNHVCPLQLDIVDRLINRYSNPGDLVLDPFGGLGTVALEAIKAGRKGYTIELNNDYFRDAVGYLKGFEENDDDAVTMFDLLGVSV